LRRTAHTNAETLLISAAIASRAGGSRTSTPDLLFRAGQRLRGLLFPICSLSAIGKFLESK